MAGVCTGGMSGAATIGSLGGDSRDRGADTVSTGCAGGLSNLTPAAPSPASSASCPRSMISSSLTFTGSPEGFASSALTTLTTSSSTDGTETASSGCSLEMTSFMTSENVGGTTTGASVITNECNRRRRGDTLVDSTGVLLAELPLLLGVRLGGVMRPDIGSVATSN